MAIIIGVVDMKGNKIFSSLCYFSICFSPLIFPFIVYIIGEKSVKYHAKKALFTHIIPYLILFIGISSSSVHQIFQNNEGASEPWITIIYLIAGIVCVYIFVWNILRGFKVLKEL